MSNTELEQFNQLKSDIALLVAPTLKLSVTSADSSGQAIEVAKNVKELLKRLDTKRKELVDPLNKRVKAINEYVKTIAAPLDQAEAHLRSELNRFATEQEKIRQAELQRLEQERLEVERKAREERERQEEELRLKQEAEAEAHVEAANLFGADPISIAESNDELDTKLSAEWEAQQEKFKQEEALRESELKQKEWDARNLQIKNTQKVISVLSADLEKVPKQFLIIELDQKKAIAAYKAGIEVPGVQFKEEQQVKIGRNTYVPKGLRYHG